MTTEVVGNRSNIRLLNILDNLTLISDVYNQVVEIDEVENIEIAKTTKVLLNDMPFSFFYLMKRKFYYINKHNVKIKVNFNMNKGINKIYFTFKILLMTGKIQCNNFRCREYYCVDKLHYFHKKTDIQFTCKNENVDELMIELQNKMHDFINCDNCLTIWDMNTQYKQEGIDLDHNHTCDNCIFVEHLNKKTLEDIGDCSICLKKMYCNNSIKTECNHTYHKMCLEIWLKDKDTCPMCRATI